MFTSRRTRVATLIAAGVLGFGGVAAAGPAALQMMTEEPAAEEPVVEEPVVEEPVVEEPVVEEPVVEEPVVEEPVVEEPVVEEDAGMASQEVEKAAEVEEEPAPMPVMLDDPATDFFDESQCLPGNHGKTVSAVARGMFEYYERDENGMLTDKLVQVEVRDAARSSCGKEFEGVDPTEQEPVEIEAEEFEVEDIDEPEEPKGPPDHAGGKDKGKPDHAGGKDKGKPDHVGGKDKGGPPAHAGGKGKGRG